MGNKGFKPQLKAWEGGYSEVTAASLKAVTIPDRIKCMVCKKSKNQVQFSTKQLNDLRWKIRSFGQGTIPSDGCIKCSLCTGKQRTEMKCIRCRQTKGLDRFSLAQRRKGDDTVCLDCQDDVDWTAIDERSFTTGFDDSIVEDEDDESTDSASNVYEVTSNGEYAVSDILSDTASNVGSDGGVYLSSYSQRTSVKSLTQDNLERLAGLNLTNPRPTIGGLPSAEPSRAASAAVAWNKFATDTASSRSVARDGVWTQRPTIQTRPRITSVATGGENEGNVWTGQNIIAAAKTYTAFDPQGRAYRRKQSISTADSTFADEPGRSARSNAVGTEKFPRVRPTPRARPKKLGASEETEPAFRVAGMDDSDSEDEYF